MFDQGREHFGPGSFERRHAVWRDGDFAAFLLVEICLPSLRQKQVCAALALAHHTVLCAGANRGRPSSSMSITALSCTFAFGFIPPISIDGAAASMRIASLSTANKSQGSRDEQEKAGLVPNLFSMAGSAATSGDCWRAVGAGILTVMRSVVG